MKEQTIKLRRAVEVLILNITVQVIITVRMEPIMEVALKTQIAPLVPVIQHRIIQQTHTLIIINIKIHMIHIRITGTCMRDSKENTKEERMKEGIIGICYIMLFGILSFMQYVSSIYTEPSQRLIQDTKICT